MVQAQAAPSSSPPAGARYEDSTNELSVEVGKAVLVDCAQPIKQVAVGTAEVAEATAISPTEIMITGKGAGATSLILWDIHGGRQFFNVTVRPSVGLTGENLDAIRRELKTELPGQTIRVTYTNNSVFLRGTVSDLTSSARAVQIASTAGKVVNLLDVNVPKSDPQILLKVRFAAVDRNLARQLGINLFDLGLGNALGGVSAGQFSPPNISGSSSSSSSSGSGLTGSAGSASFSQEGSIFAFFPGLNVGADIHALVTRGVVQMLAEPNVMASDGKEASFLAGGEFPYPVVSGTSGGTAAVSIEYKEYGVRLNFIPTITPRGTIRLQVAPEVSALDYSNEVEISGFEVPGLTTRRVNTEVELKDGQTFILGGLLDKNMTETFQKIPFLGDIPIIGKLFQSQIKNKTDTELIVLVTPEIVAPLPAGTPTPDLKYPGQFLPPNSNIPMHQPDEKTADNTLPPPAPAIPVETLIQSMKPEKPLIIESGTGGFGQGGATVNPGGSSSSNTSTGGSGTPQQ
jgi:pilus assembly protein CpaC